MKTKNAFRLMSFCTVIIILTAVHGSEEVKLPPDVHEQLELPGPEISISVDEVTRLAFLQDPNVIIAGLAYDAFTTNEMLAESIYDFNLRGQGGWTNDRKPPDIIFLSRQTDTRDFLVGLSKLLPLGTLIDFESSSLRTDEDSEYATVNPSYAFNYTARLKQPLLKNALGYIDRGTIAVVRFDIRQFDYTTLDEIEGFLLQARKAYWDLLEAQETFYSESRALQSSADFYRLTVNKLPFGLTEEPDVIAADGNLRRYYIRAIIAKSQYESASDILKSIIDLKNDGYLRAESKEIQEPRINIDAQLRLAFEKRFDYKRALLESQKKGLELKMKTVGLLPQLDFEGSFQLNSLKRRLDEAAGAAWDADGRAYFIGGTLEFPLNNRKARAERQRVAIEKKKALEQIKETELSMIKDVLVAARKVNTSYEAALQSEKIEKLEAEKLEAEHKRFLQGRSDSDTIIRFQFDKFEAQIFNIQSLAEHERSLDELLRSTNSLIDTVSDEKSARPSAGGAP
jgi:outer membrane protein